MSSENRLGRHLFRRSRAPRRRRVPTETPTGGPSSALRSPCSSHRPRTCRTDPPGAQCAGQPSVACPDAAYRKPSPAGTQDSTRDHVRGGCDAIARHRTLPVTVADGTSGGTVGIVCTSSRSDAEPGAGRSRHRSRQRRRQCSRMPCRTPCMSRCTGIVAAARASSSPPRSLATVALPCRAAPLSFSDIVAERQFRMDSLTRVKVLTPAALTMPFPVTLAIA